MLKLVRLRKWLSCLNKYCRVGVFGLANQKNSTFPMQVSALGKYEAYDPFIIAQNAKQVTMLLIRYVG
ncbi:hypothetical protein H5410_060645 [Solanum commersonii]|uniref:Uncharacterized protein n=1 Tax=Solanum commersonii TaxID=4109 RepID=A0A9J5W697_SOLCO|nr:hypothetical protein H5410_060645 [Solanum commersonii]